MDCTDRERGQWIGDVSVQAPQIFYAMDENAVPLLKKAIMNFIGLRKGDRLVGNVPGMNSKELPAQSLNAISEFGMIAAYYEFTNDLPIRYDIESVADVLNEAGYRTGYIGKWHLCGIPRDQYIDRKRRLGFQE